MITTGSEQLELLRVTNRIVRIEFSCRVFVNDIQ